MTKVESIKASEFRNNSTSYALKKVNFFFGKNGSGKTSVIDALMYAMTGDVDEEVRGGTFINVTTSGNTISVEKKAGKNAKSRINGKAVTKEAALRDREQIFGMNPAHAKQFFSEGEGILYLKPPEMSKFLCSFVKSPAPLSLLGLSADEEAELAGFANLSGGLTIPLIEEIEKNVSSAFTAANKKLNEANAVVSVFNPSAITRPIPVLQSARKRLQEKILLLQESERKLAVYNSEKAKYEQYQADLKETAEKVKKSRVAPPSSEAINDAQKKLLAIRSNIANESADIKVMKDTLDTSERILSELSTNICPISKQIVCCTDKTPVKEEIQGNIDSLSSRIAIKQRRVEAMLVTEKTTSELYEKLRKEELAYNEFVRLDERYKNLLAHAPECPVAPSISTGNEKIEQLNEQLNNLSRELLRAENIQKAEAIIKTIPMLEQKAMLYSKFKKMFAPRGEAYLVVLQSVSNIYETMLNQLASDFGCNITYRLVPNDGLMFMAETHGNLIPVKNLSNGEKMITRVLLNLMFNEISGGSLIILDNIDQLDTDNIDKLLDILSRSKGMFETAILCGVNHKDMVDSVKSSSLFINERTVYEL